MDKTGHEKVEIQAALWYNEYSTVKISKNPVELTENYRFLCENGKAQFERNICMKYVSMLISVADINAARKFYEDLFELEIFQDYGRNIVFTCSLALQQDFDWLVNLPKEKVLKKSNNAEIVFEEQDFDGFLNKLKAYPDIEYLGEVIEHSWGQRVIRFYDLDGHIIEVGEDMKMVIKRFLASGMTMEEVSVKMDASVDNLTNIINN